MKLPGLTLLLLPFFALSAEPDVLLSELQVGEPIKRVAPKYPISEAKSGKEGWVRVDFVVNKEGSVADAVVLDSSGVDGFEREALRAVKRWRYQPAMIGEKPVEQCYKVQLDFVLERNEPGVTRRFAHRITAIQQLLEEQQLDAAKVQLEQLRRRPKWNLTEDAWYWMVDAVYQEYKGNTEEQIASLSRATGNSKGRLPAPQQRYLLQTLFVLQTRQNQFAKALENFEALKQVKGSAEPVKALQPYVDKIYKTIEGEQPLVVQASINEREQWYHHLSRSGFELADIKGQLDTLEVRCERQQSTYKAVEGSAWIIPKAWGQCKVLVKGRPASEFKLIEVQPQTGPGETAAP